MEDYSGKVNRHEDYLELLNQLEKKCIYIEYVSVDDDDTRLTEQFKRSVIAVRPKNKWWGTKSSRRRNVYKIKASRELFQYLRRFETFCKYTVSDMGDLAQTTDFGINDIAFFDERDLPLLFTTTHEGYITVRKDLLSQLTACRTRGK